ncbi:MAG: M67 family metallopeptidase [Chloroflexi bacterium]|nr:M67 family metallopeptidase [Chloroflexota bacterium]
MMRLVIAEKLYQDILRHLIATFPNEGGGFLIGTLAADQRTVTEVHPVENVFEAEEQFHRFLAEDGAFQRFEDDADARGLVLLGYYHSHPDAPAIPSEFDRVHAWPHFAYVIVSVRSAEAVEMRVWQLQDDRSGFDEGELAIQPT